MVTESHVGFCRSMGWRSTERAALSVFLGVLLVINTLIVVAGVWTVGGVAAEVESKPMWRRPLRANEPGTYEELQVKTIDDSLRADYRLAPFYQKVLVLDGIPIVGSSQVSDYAFLECAWIVHHMLDGLAGIRQALVDNKVRIGIIGVTEYTMDIPENQRPSMMARGAYHDRRSRGLGGVQLTTCGEENLLELRGDPYRLENIFIHEFAHTIASNLRRTDPGWWDRLTETYRRAMDEGLWANTYAATNVQEYWAEGTQSWFDCNAPRNDGRVHNGIWNREQLKSYDPRLAQLLADTYGDRSWRYEKPSVRAPEQQTHLRGLNRDEMPEFSFDRSPRIQAERSGQAP